MFKIRIIFLLILYYTAVIIKCEYKPTWESLDKRPLPSWYDKAKIGIFIHWGVFSVPSFHSEWFWQYWKNNNSEIVQFMDSNFPTGFTYQDFANQFTAELFDPDSWADLFKKSGVKYVVFTSKHHEGYAMWPSTYSYSWNSKDLGPNKDIVGELSKAVRSKGLHFGLYHSLYEWFHPLYLLDKNNNYTTRHFVRQKVIPEMIELIETYRPDILWSDGDWDAPDSYWLSTEFLAWLYNESPTKEFIVANDRWGKGIPCHHGDFYTCEDRYNPGILQKHKWENAMTLDQKSWGFRRNAKLEDYLDIKELLLILAQTVSCGGNLCINIGPTKDGIISPIFEDRLTALGKWLSINGEAIYESTPWDVQNDTISQAWYTSRANFVYSIFFSWPKNSTLTLGSVCNLFETNTTKVNLLGYSTKLQWNSVESETVIHLPDKAFVEGEWAWVLKIKK